MPRRTATGCERATAGQPEYRRVLSLFYADHDRDLPRALELARQDLQERQDIYGHDALAWALLKNGHPEEAARAMTEALKLGTRDARLFFHAGMIYHRLRDPSKARDYLGRALALNPQLLAVGRGSSPADPGRAGAGRYDPGADAVNGVLSIEAATASALPGRPRRHEAGSSRRC